MEAVKRGNSLEDQCSSLEDRLVQVLEEGEVERRKAVEAARSKFKETLLQQVQELQRQVAALQSHIRNNPLVDRGNSPSKEATNSGTSQGTSKEEPVVTADCTNCKRSGSDKTDCSVVQEAVSKQPSASDSHQAKDELSAALLTQQLTPLPKFNGSSDDEEWIAQFELVAEVCKGNAQAKLIHLTTCLHGEAFAFYRSCSKSQKADYDQLVKELTRRFTPVRIQAVQTSLFHGRKQVNKKQ